MARYELWQTDELRDAIIGIERNLAAGINQISNPTQGSIGYTSRADAEAILRDLYRAYYKSTGQTDKLRQNGSGMRIFAMTGGREF